MPNYYQPTDLALIRQALENESVKWYTLIHVLMLYGIRRGECAYMVMADFKDYRRAQHDLQQLYRDKQKWNHMSLKNIANAGIFSADRSIMDYARDIWGAAPVK